MACHSLLAFSSFAFGQAQTETRCVAIYVDTDSNSAHSVNAKGCWKFPFFCRHTHKETETLTGRQTDRRTDGQTQILTEFRRIWPCFRVGRRFVIVRLLAMFLCVCGFCRCFHCLRHLPKSECVNNAWEPNAIRHTNTHTHTHTYIYKIYIYKNACENLPLDWTMNWVEGPQTFPVGFAIATLIVSFVLFVCCMLLLLLLLLLCWLAASMVGKLVCFIDAQKHPLSHTHSHTQTHTRNTHAHVWIVKYIHVCVHIYMFRYMYVYVYIYVGNVMFPLGTHVSLGECLEWHWAPAAVFAEWKCLNPCERVLGI